MRSVILAAGRSSRLGKLCESLPKSCLGLSDNETILERSLKLMKNQGFSEIFIVTGHCQEKISELLDGAWQEAFSKIELVYNPEYASRNNIYTAYIIRELFGTGTILFNSDIVYDEKILESAVNTAKNSSESFMVVDDHKKLIDEDMKVILEGTNIRRINKNLNNESSQGEYIGILHLNDNDADLFRASLEKMITDQEFDKYYEDALDRITSELELKTVSTEGLEWVEIDFIEDYERAKNLECVKQQSQNNYKSQKTIRA